MNCFYISLSGNNLKYYFSGALAVGLYGNEISHKGIGKIETSTRKISEVVHSVKNQVNIYTHILFINFVLMNNWNFMIIHSFYTFNL